MAWTLTLLLGIILMTASANKCIGHAHTDYENTDNDPRNQYAGLESSGLPNNRAYGRMNTKSAETLTGYNVPDDIQSAQFRMEKANQRDGSDSRVLSRKPLPAMRHGHDNSKVVFPGPTSEEYRLEIPEHCKKLGICEDVPNYPTELVKNIISESTDMGMFQNDKLDIPDVPDIAQRVGPSEENLELCSFQEKVVYPKAAVDSNGNWHVVLNQDDNPIQGFKVEICDTDSSPCSQIVFFQSGYKGRCKQKYVYRKMAVFHNETGKYTKLERSLKVPSCCSCVAKIDLQ